MTLTKQLTPYTCIPACLESYFADTQVDMDQCRILRDYPQFCLNPKKIEQFGVMSELQLICFTRLFQVVTTPFMHLDQQSFISILKALTINDTVFVMSLWKKETYHCVRFSQIIDEANGLYEFMCPAFGGASMETVSFNDLMQGGFRVFLLKKAVVGQPQP